MFPWKVTLDRFDCTYYVMVMFVIRRIYYTFFFKASGSHEQIQIEDNATGFGMEKLFSRFMTEFLTEIEIEDPYIRSHHQVMNDV